MTKKEETDAAVFAPIDVEETVVELPKSRQRLKEKYPSDSFETDDDWESGFNRYLDETDEKLERYGVSEKSINELLEANPELLSTIVDIQGGMPAIHAIGKNFDIDIPVEDGDSDWEKIRADKAAAAKKRREDEDIIAANEAESFTNLDSFYEENGFTDEQKQEFEKGIAELLQNLLYRKISPDFIRAYHNSRNYDSDIKAAAEAARIAAKNETIEKKIEKEAAKKKGDGLPGSSAVTDTDDIPAVSRKKGLTEEDYYRNKNNIHRKFI
jgi:hypothetical protein